MLYSAVVESHLLYTLDHQEQAFTPSRTASPRPFVKWAGGKRKLLPKLVKHMPRHFRRFHEPFVGGGALFFHLNPSRACLSDINGRLVKTYRAIRDDPHAIIRKLNEYPNDKEFYLEMRAREIDRCSDIEIAAWFIYLNRTGFNGLYRVNRRNRFNVPYGRYANPRICDEQNLLACSQALQGVSMRNEDFSGVLDRAEPGDFVYFDPPYVPLSATSSFTAYTKDKFRMEDQIRLRDLALELKRRGVFVLLSNSGAQAVYDLYDKSQGFDFTEIKAARAINSVASKRGAVNELVIW